MVKNLNCPHCGEPIQIEFSDTEKTPEGFLKVLNGKAICPKCNSAIYDGDVEVKE